MKSRKYLDIGERDSVLLEQEDFRVVINSEKAMVPELSVKKGAAWVNAHWNPWFRSNSGQPWDAKLHEDYWKVPLLYDIAGNFPCCPSVGPGHVMKDGRELPPHGFTALMTWNLDSQHEGEDKASADWSLDVPDHSLSYKKTDMILKDHPVHYSRLAVTNNSDHDEPLNCTWHNTVGAPFLETGCRIDNNAKQFAVPPLGTEFDDTGRFEPGSIFTSLKEVPLRGGGTADGSVVPGHIGYTDFVTAAVPSDCSLGWSSIVNPVQKLVYLAWFKGPEAVDDSCIPVNFYSYWYNFGGRPFRPWAPEDGGTDRSWCFGAECGLNYFANGLQESLDHGDLLGNATSVVLKPGETRVQDYATAFFSYEGDALDEGISDVRAGESGIIVTGRSGKTFEIKGDAGFSALA